MDRERKRQQDRQSAEKPCRHALRLVVRRELPRREECGPEHRRLNAGVEAGHPLLSEDRTKGVECSSVRRPVAGAQACERNVNWTNRRHTPQPRRGQGTGRCVRGGWEGSRGVIDTSLTLHRVEVRLRAVKDGGAEMQQTKGRKEGRTEEGRTDEPTHGQTTDGRTYGRTEGGREGG